MSVTTIAKIWYDADDNEKKIVLPGKYEVCRCCAGKGTRVNPAIDGHGISREEFDADPDFEEAYFAGVYDVVCEECKGERLITVVDENALTPSQRILYEEIREREIEDERQRRADARVLRTESGMGF